MKNLKIVLATLFIAILGIAVSSFTVETYNSRAFAVSCYKVRTGVSIDVFTINNPAAAAHISEIKAINGSYDGVPDTGNWYTTPVSNFTPNGTCPSTSKVCAVCFDAGNTGKTLQDILNELERILELGTFTFADGATFTFSGFTVTVYEYNPNA